MVMIEGTLKRPPDDIGISFSMIFSMRFSIFGALLGP